MGLKEKTYVICNGDPDYYITMTIWKDNQFKDVKAYLKNELTPGRIYELIDSNNKGEYLIKNDQNQKLWYEKQFFTSVRGAKLQRILKNNETV